MANSLWVSAADEQTMLTDLGAEFDRISAHGLAVLHARVAALNVPRTLPELLPGVQQRLDECRARMVVVCELQRRTHNVSKIKRGIGIAGSAVGAALKWLTGLAAK